MPAFALDLDHDGIHLLHKAEGGWICLDQVALDDPDLPSRLNEMRIAAEQRADGSLETELIIPPSQILYARRPIPGDAAQIRDEDVIAGLDGLTPCPLEELVIDWRRDGDEVRVAALDINTLDEAENFATTYGFNPVRFTARPGPEDFPDVPDFGATQFAKRHLEPEEPAAFVSKRTEETAPPEAEPEAPIDAPETAEASDTSDDALPDVAEAPTEPAISRADPPEEAPPVAAPVIAVEPTKTESPKAVPPVAKPKIVAPPKRVPPRPAARPAEPAGPLLRKPSGSSVATATGALLTIGLLVWTALYLVTPKVDTRLPEVAETPNPTPESEEVPTARAVPSRAAPVLADHIPLPAFPAAEDAPGPGEEMAARGQLALLAPETPDPTTEVGVLKSAAIWQKPLSAMVEPVESLLDGLYVASIDPVVSVDDAFALAAAPEADAVLSEQAIPPSLGEAFDLDEYGLVRATPEGAMTPNGAFVIAGAPPKRPPPRPTVALETAQAETALALAGKEPRKRPDDLVEQTERAQLGGRSKEELSGIRPKPRPASAQIEAAIEAALQGDSSPSPLAVAVSRAPSRRPADFAAVVAAQQAARGLSSNERAPIISAAVAPAQPRIPSSASVSRQATIENAINLRKLNLIGVYGSDSDRRALLRLPSGRYVKVKVGDRIDGGQVGAIGDNELRYIKGGRNMTLTVPSG